MSGPSQSTYNKTEALKAQMQDFMLAGVIEFRISLLTKSGPQEGIYK
jgi:hypothetical protein